jgi:hypothetical protein
MRCSIALASLLMPALFQAQATPSTAAPSGLDQRWRVSLTLFRSPGTGIQVQRGKVALFAVHYPTIFERDGAQRTTHFVRIGVAAYARTTITSPYLSVSVAPSLTRGWPTSALLDAGWRQGITDRLSGQLGAALLVAPSLRTTRINPTIGLGVKL